LTGFRKYIPKLTIIRSNNSTSKGRETNEEHWDPDTKTWTLSVGDSAESWAKSIGKLLAGKYPAKKLVLDFSQIRKPGIRLKNYGWLSQGDVGLTKAYTKVFNILNAKADSLLSEIDILDIMNLLGTVLSTRRSAQIAVMDDYNPIVYIFAEAKAGIWENGLEHRSQSNNSIIFWNKPTKEQLAAWFEKINRGGNGEPGLINGQQMKARAPWAIGMNPCAEILLPNKGFCNLVSIDLLKFKGDVLGLHRAAKIIARANYRQTSVDFRDGILQESWHLNNAHLRLCGVSLMGIAGRPDMGPYDFSRLERTATAAAISMADELGMPQPKNTTA
jgi:ribonucleoside-triphosphate reductase